MSKAEETTFLKKKAARPMDFLLKSPLLGLKSGDLADGAVITKRTGRIYIDLGERGAGIIWGAEYLGAKDLIKKINPGDKIKAKVVEPENDEGYIELSLREVDGDLIWKEAEELRKNKTPLELKVLNANKGGLILEWKKIQGFLPASQLGSEHYPRVEDASADKITQELKKFIGETFKVAIIDASQQENKLIFSEKELKSEELQQKISKYKVGDIVEGEITGVVDFGIFIKIEDGLEGLAHVSQLDWGIIEDPQKIFKVGEKTKAKIVEISDGKLSLSLKALKSDPWQDIEKKYKKGDVVKGVVVKIDKYGILISLEEGIGGLVHLSEFGSEEIMRKKIEIGKTYPFQISLIEAPKRKLILNYIEEGK